MRPEKRPNNPNQEEQGLAKRPRLEPIGEQFSRLIRELCAFHASQPLNQGQYSELLTELHACCQKLSRESSAEEFGSLLSITALRVIVFVAIKKGQGQCLAALAPRLAQLELPALVGLLQATVQEGPDKEKNVLWMIAAAATCGQGQCLAALTPRLAELALQDLVGLLQASAQEGPEKGQTVLWMIAAAATNGQGQCLAALAPRLAELEPASLVGVLQASAQEGPDKGKTVLWTIACAATKGQGQCLAALAPRLAQLELQDLVGLLQATVQEGPAQGKTVLWMIAAAATHGQGQCLAALASRLVELEPASLVDLLQATSQEGPCKGASVLWLMVKVQGQCFTALTPRLAELALQDLVGLLQASAQEGPEKGQTVLWMIADAANKDSSECLVALASRLLGLYNWQGFERILRLFSGDLAPLVRLIRSPIVPISELHAFYYAMRKELMSQPLYAGEIILFFEYLGGVTANRVAVGGLFTEDDSRLKHQISDLLGCFEKEFFYREGALSYVIEAIKKTRGSEFLIDKFLIPLFNRLSIIPVGQGKREFSRAKAILIQFLNQLELEVHGFVCLLPGGNPHAEMAKESYLNLACKALFQSIRLSDCQTTDRLGILVQTARGLWDPLPRDTLESLMLAVKTGRIDSLDELMRCYEKLSAAVVAPAPAENS